MASRGRPSVGASVSNKTRTRSAQSAAHVATRRRSASLSDCGESIPVFSHPIPLGVPRTVPEVSDSVADMEQQFAQGNNSSDQESSTANIHEALPVVAFATRAELRDWLSLEHARSSGIWVRLARSGTALCSISFHDLLEEGLCFGWSESTRHRGDAQTFLQKFTPRRSRGTKSERNSRMFEALQAQGRMTAAGEAAMGTAHR